MRNAYPAHALDPFTEPSVKARICSGKCEDILLAKSGHTDLNNMTCL